MGISIDKLQFDPTVPSDNQRVGSFLIGLAGDVITSTTFGGVEALDVNIAGSTGMGIYAEDSAAVSGDLGQPTLALRQDSLVTGATSADGDYAWLKVNAKSELYIKDTDALARLVLINSDTTAILADTATIDSNLALVLADTTAILADTASMDTNIAAILADTATIDSNIASIVKAEDAAHSSGDAGVMSLSVRRDTPSALGADGDYSPQTLDNKARLHVNGSHNVAWQTSVETVGVTAVELCATPLSGRKTVLIVNNGSKSIYLGETNAVTTSSGIEIPQHASMEFQFGEILDMWAISGTAGQNVRIMEAA